MITNENLLMEGKTGGWTRRIYRFLSGYGLFLVKSPLAHDSEYAWGVKIIKDITDSGGYDLTYTTHGGLLPKKVKVFKTDKQANAFIAKAKKLLDVPEYKEKDNEERAGNAA